MDEFELPADDQNRLKNEADTWFTSLPAETAELLNQLEHKIEQIETFDVLANISYYNHLHDSQKYEDYRGDKMFVVSELISLIALKRPYVNQSAVDMYDGAVLLKEIQNLGIKYQTLTSILQSKNALPENHHSIEGIAFRTMRDETTVRNPALPEHHLMFSEELYASLEIEIKSRFGFTMKETVELRNAIVKLINDRVNDGRKSAEEKAWSLAREVFKYRATKLVPDDSSLSKENLEGLNKLSRKQINETCFNHCMNDFFFHLGQVFSFTAEDLSAAANVDLASTKSFLAQFSCTFPSLLESDPLVGPTNILKSKPFVENDGRFLLPSMPLLTWCVDPVIESYFKSVPRLQDRFKSIKHDFLLKKGREFLSKIFNEKVEIFTNLYYYVDGDTKNRFETDGIFRYERTLFIIEAKAHRISEAAKAGKVLRTQKHMEQIVKESYEQGYRTLNYIKSKPSVDFLTEKKQKVTFQKNDFDDIILISLVLEPIGNVTPLIRATNDLGYFQKDIFPWVISIYDLVVIADHLDLSGLLPHYIKRRREFLERKIMYVFEEIDLLANYLFNRLYIEPLFLDAESKDVSIVHMGNETDEINNYYMHRYKLKTPNPPRLRLNVPDVCMKILSAIEKSDFSHRQTIMLHILDLSPTTMEKIGAYIKEAKKMFARDGKRHDCSILTHIWGSKVGFTFMTGADKPELDRDLYLLCRHKMEEQGAKVWIGVGDSNKSLVDFDIQSAFVARNTP